MTSLLRVYRWCAHLRWPTSYVGKFLLTAFIGVHIPLIAMTIYVILSLENLAPALPILIVGLLATLFGTGLTLLFQQQLLAPIVVTSEAIERYTRDRTMPALPTIYDDEAGRLMHNTQHCLTHLDQLIAMKNDLLAVISHDTRGPLSNIVLASQMLDLMLRNPQENLDEIRSFNQQIRNSALRQAELMNNLMLLARADSGQLEVERSVIELRELLTRALSNNQLRADQKGVQLVLAGDADLQQSVRIDAAKTEQILNNLIQNAVKFTPAGGTVRVEAGVADQQLTILVRDTGIGMDRAVREQLFTPFARERRAGTAGEPGSGLGLWICKTFTDVQGGTIVARSEPGSGTTFEVRLPTTMNAQDAAAHAELHGALIPA